VRFLWMCGIVLGLQIGVRLFHSAFRQLDDRLMFPSLSSVVYLWVSFIRHHVSHGSPFAGGCLRLLIDGVRSLIKAV
jgi:hypothetical protein